METKRSYLLQDPPNKPAAMREPENLWTQPKWNNIATARAVDLPLSRPPSGTPCFLGGCAPQTPKRRSAPWAAVVVRLLATEPLVWGRCAARGRTFSQKSDVFFEQTTSPGQLRCLAQFVVPEI